MSRPRLLNPLSTLVKDPLGAWFGPNFSKVWNICPSSWKVGLAAAATPFSQKFPFLLLRQGKGKTAQISTLSLLTSLNSLISTVRLDGKSFFTLWLLLRADLEFLGQSLRGLFRLQASAVRQISKDTEDYYNTLRSSVFTKPHCVAKNENERPVEWCQLFAQIKGPIVCGLSLNEPIILAKKLADFALVFWRKIMK